MSDYRTRVRIARTDDEGILCWLIRDLLEQPGERQIGRVEWERIQAPSDSGVHREIYLPEPTVIASSAAIWRPGQPTEDWTFDARS